MAYTSNIPQPNDDLSVSQPQILANFTEIATAFNLNHGPFNSATEGKHAFVEMPNQNAAPPTTIANEVGLYCNTSAYSPITGPEPALLFIKQFGTSAPAPLNSATGYEITTSNYIANGGWTRLPSGILIMWGFGTVPNNATPITLPISATIPNFYTIYQVLITTTSSAGGIPYIVGLNQLTQPTNGLVPTAGAFTVNSNTFVVGINYLVIGV